MTALPSALGLDLVIGPQIKSAELQTNFQQIQDAVNQILTALSAGVGGQYLTGNGAALTYVAAPSTPSSEVAYQEFTAPVGLTHTTEALADVIVTAGAFAADGATAYIIEFFCPDLTGVDGSDTNVWLFQDGASIGKLEKKRTTAGGGLTLETASHLERRLVPAAGSHTYSVRGSRSAVGTSVANAGLGGLGLVVPGFIRIRAA